jgi:alpha-beta hydrolase superfamily lysophospholipase
MHEVDLLAYPVVFGAKRSGDRYGGVDNVVLESYRYVPRNAPSDTVVVFMHPTGGLTYLPFLRHLARSGVHVISSGNRTRGVDAYLIVENMLIDLQHVIEHARSKFGYKKVVLGGWSGGGAPALYYQSQAEHPSVTDTPGGDGPDLVAAGLQPADAMLVIAAHSGRPQTLAEFIDPSVLDEIDMSIRDPSLDLYDPDNSEKPPYSAAYLERYRAAQLSRVRRITDWAKAELASGASDHGFVVRKTMADPKWLDPTIDPNDRVPGTCFMGDPRLANDAPAGVARFSTPRSWLSQWSYDDSLANGPVCATHVTVPTLVVTNSADDACGASHGMQIFDSLASPDKRAVTIEGASHYYISEDRTPMESATATVIEWMTERGLHQT